MNQSENTEIKINEVIEESSDTNNYKELFGKLRSAISSSKDSYRNSLAQTKELILQKEDELNLLRIRQHKLEGAIEASDGFLLAVLPNNNKLRPKE